MWVKKLLNWVKSGIVTRERLKIRGFVRLTFEDIFTGEKTIIEYHNLWVNAGKDYCLNLLGKQSGYTGLNYTSIGTSNSSASLSDVKLGTERGRRPISTSTLSTSQTITLSSFYEAGYPGTTYDIQEIGLWGDATGTTDSGYLFARTVISAQQKVSGTKTLTVDWVLSA